MKIIFKDSGLTKGTIKISTDGGSTFVEHNIEDIKENGLELDPDQRLDKVMIKGPANIIKDMDILSKIKIDTGLNLEDSSPRIEYSVSKNSSDGIGSSLYLDISKGSDIFHGLIDRGCIVSSPGWADVSDGQIKIDSNMLGYDYEEGSYVSPEGEYSEPSSDDPDYEEKIEEYVQNYSSAQIHFTEEVASLLRSATIGFDVDGMWIPMIFI